MGVTIILIICVIILFARQNSLSDDIRELSAKIESLTASKKIEKTKNTEQINEIGEILHEPKKETFVAEEILPETEKKTFVEEEIFAAPEKKPLFNNENWVGVSLFNRVGALLIIIGAIATAAYDGFHPVLRTVILFSFAIAVVIFGEFMNRKKPTTFSTGISATGVALIYVAIATSYFGLETLGMYPALFLCVVATAFGIFLAIRYKAEVIGCFALIGGYLPIFALDLFNETLLVGLVVYFVFLSLFSLIIAVLRKWSAMNIIGFVLTVLGTSYLGVLANENVALIYACFAFLIYTAIPIIATTVVPLENQPDGAENRERSTAFSANDGLSLKRNDYNHTKEDFRELDFWLIISNTFVSSLVIFLIATRLEIENLHAYLSLAFALIYAGLAWFVRRMRILFTLSAIAFAFLFVPFYFEQKWFATAWLLQAAVLACYGVICNKKIAEMSGLTVLFFSAAALFSSKQFTFDYSFFTAGTLAIFACYLSKSRHFVGYELALKIAALANFWCFALYLVNTYVDFIYLEVLIALITFVMAFAYTKINFFADNGTKILANLMHSFGMLIVLFSIFGDGLWFTLFAAIIGFAWIIYFYVTNEKNEWIISYKNAVVGVFWFVSSFILARLTDDVVNGWEFILSMYMLAFAFFVTKFPAIYDRALQIISVLMYSFAIFWLYVFNFNVYSANLFYVLNTAAQTFALVALYDVFKNFKSKIIILSGYILFVLTQLLLVQTKLDFNSAAISIIYALAAFAWIVAGFTRAVRAADAEDLSQQENEKENQLLRKAGLILSMASVAKLLVVDTWNLSTEMRIVSYISLGLILMLISFIYQKLNKKID
jgi:uncharacterized membrane protein